MLKLEKDGLISRSEYSKILSNFDNANLMETYYKARKNIGNSMAQQNFVNMGGMNTLRKKTTKDRRKTILDSFRKLTKGRPGTIKMIIGDKKRKTTKRSHEMDKDQIIEEHEKESESNNTNSNNKDINSYNLSISNNNSIQETENNKINRSYNKAKQTSKQNLQRRNNVFRMEEQEAIANLVSMYNNPLLFGLKNLCENINSDDEEQSDFTKSENSSKSLSRNEERKGTLSKSNASSSRSIDFDNIKSVEEEPIVKVEKKPEEKLPKKMKMKIQIKKKIKVKKKIKIKIKVKKVQKKEPEINFNDYNFDWLNLINK